MSIHTIMERMVILYLDDDHDDLEILVEILAADGVSIFTFSDRDAFFNGLHENHGPSAMVFLDILMPKISGVEILQAIRSQKIYACLPVIMLTSNLDDTLIRYSFDLGANYYVRKSPVYTELKQHLDTIFKQDWSQYEPSFEHYVLSS